MERIQSQVPHTAPVIVKQKVGDDCPHCSESLVYREYKGNDSAFCENCETPIIHVFTNEQT